MQRSLYIITFLFIPILSSCFKQEEYSEIPQITYTDFVITGDEAKLIFEFTDGDGNIGLSEEDIFPPFDSPSYYHFNLYIEYWEKHPDEGWIQGTTSDAEPILFKYRIKPFTNTQKNKPIKGTIEVALEPLFYNPFSEFNDSIKYRVRLIDRALNESNTMETPLIVK